MFCGIRNVSGGDSSQTLKSDYQKGMCKIYVHTPDSYDPAKKYRVLYLLSPIADSGLGYLWCRTMNIFNKYDIIVVDLTFEKDPWYGDHSTDPSVRQASYLHDFAIPYVESHYSTLGTPEGRYLLGVSKGGWGAFSLILRNPEFYGYAGSWDAPFLLDHFEWNMEEIFGTQQQLDLFRPDLLVPQKRADFQKKTRLVLGGGTLFGAYKAPGGKDHTVEMDRLLQANGIPHVYLANIKGAHGWDPLWMEPMIKALMELKDAQP